MGGTGNRALNEATAGGSGAAAGGSSSGGTYGSVGVDGSPAAPHPLSEETLLPGAAPAAGQAPKGRRNPEAGLFTEEPRRRQP